MRRLYSICTTIRIAPGGGPSTAANLSFEWQRALVAELTDTLQQTVSVYNVHALQYAECMYMLCGMPVTAASFQMTKCLCGVTS